MRAAAWLVAIALLVTGCGPAQEALAPVQPAPSSTVTPAPPSPVPSTAPTPVPETPVPEAEVSEPDGGVVVVPIPHDDHDRKSRYCRRHWFC